MKHSILSTNFILVLLTALLLVSCSAEDGADGQDGIDGIDGADGSVNVIISEWFPSEFSNTASTLEIMSLENEIFNEETASNAIILVYGNRIDGVFGLPVVFDEESYFFFVAANQETLFIAGQNTMNRPSIYSSFQEFRYIIIPGNTAGKEHHPDFYKMSYEEVMDYFELKT